MANDRRARHVERKGLDPDDRSHVPVTRHEQAEHPSGTPYGTAPGRGRLLPEPAGEGSRLTGPGPPAPEAGERGLVRGPPLEGARRIVLVAGVRVAAGDGDQDPRPRLLGGLRLRPGYHLRGALRAPGRRVPARPRAFEQVLGTGVERGRWR